MILTGRTGLLALICVLPIALSPWPARSFVALLVALMLNQYSVPDVRPLTVALVVGALTLTGAGLING